MIVSASCLLNLYALQASCFGNLLQWTEDPRVKEYYSFEHTVVNPPWSQKDSDHDSGISTMTLINLYGDPRFPFEKIELEKVTNLSLIALSNYFYFARL